MWNPTAARRQNAISLYSFVFSGVVVICLLGCTGGEPKHFTWKNATGAEQHERLMWQAIRDKDWKEVQYRLAPTFVGISAEGQALDRAGWIEYWKRAQIKEFSLGEVSVHPAGADMVVTYVLHIGTSPGVRLVSVWQQVRGGWVLSVTSVTPLSPG